MVAVSLSRRVSRPLQYYMPFSSAMHYKMQIVTVLVVLRFGCEFSDEHQQP